MSKKNALILMFCILGALLILHTLIITEQIPYEKVWAGKLRSVEEMRLFETFSILLNVFILAILILKYNFLQRRKNNRVIDMLIWVFVWLFILNTMGNLFAKSMIELVLGTLVTLASAILCFIIVRKKSK
jgi:RsiW-degrading membrane proteinase PrsW (M82 family)